MTESVVEDAALSWLESLGYVVLHSPDIAAGEPAAERGLLEARQTLDLLARTLQNQAHCYGTPVCRLLCERK